ncbi:MULTISPECIES: malate dehydrogenase (quinone) [Pontibacillus]|uniref:Probable malate:quinone oxidoreductase n=1 Tax=Pontibacillus chungwhensis TaxID=265426 RepID=A0ABY8UWP3_9BACI|nr:MULTISPECIES: malate dehydrogenase (quinone) [Pontibacillus]MCD5325654.1 malate dehydrogenase (quinone) [Pontibacillus sp. HN14]WIF98100.1 malate dehydrogenase (quinone) [Pontibacillus chungwhensis]
MSKNYEKTDAILIGAGIMSATLGSLLKELVPEWKIRVFEKLNSAGEESSNVWNNAGTGHAALCELNYTKEQSDGSIDISKAIKVNEQFQVSKQFWTYLIQNDRIKKPQEFIMPLPHLSFVQGKQNVEFLRKRYRTMSEHPQFQGMQFSDNQEELKAWMPVMMESRNPEEAVAATKMDSGTDVNFGTITRKMFDYLEATDVELNYQHSVQNLNRLEDGSWEVKVLNQAQNRIEYHVTDFVFIGGGGGSLHLLQKSGIPESKHIGGFPVSGQFLVCNNPEVVEKHNAKVYGKAKVGAPPMSVPHLDTRYIDGKRTLLFGPFAGFSPKFLKKGSFLDLFTSVKTDNLATMSAAGVKNASLTKYLIEQVVQSKEKRMEELREFIPDANSGDWSLSVAGQRVQVIKDTDDSGKGTLQFGTEVVHSSDGSIAALLGASPGASTAVQVMLDLMESCFPQQMEEWKPRIQEMIPSYGLTLADHPELLKDIHKNTDQALGLNKRPLYSYLSEEENDISQTS